MAELVAVSAMEEVERLYRIPESEEVGEFLRQRPGLAEFLVEAYPHIEKQFGPRVGVELRFPRYFDGEPAEPDLAAKVLCDLEADDACDRMDRLWDEWWKDASGRPESRPLYIGIEFVSGDDL